MDSKPTLSEIENTAALWLLRRDEGRWSSADEADLAAWLAQSPSHRVAYIRLKSVWKNADRLKSVASGIPKGEIPAPGALIQTPYFALKRGRVDSDATESTHIRQANAPGTRFGARRWGFAASIAAVVGLAVAAYTAGIFESGARYTTPVGGLTTVPIVDGSTITLNTDTVIRVRITEGERRIELDRGEAFFEVAHDPTRPFTVYADDRRVVAVGTKFSVRKDRDNVRVVVTEGTVRIDTTAHAESPATAPPDLLPAGATADIAEHEIHFEQRPIPEVEESLSWRTGHIVLRRTPLPQAIEEFNRYSARKLVLEDPTLSTTTIGGNFRTNNVDGFIRLLEQGFAIEARERDGQVYLARKRR